MGENITGISNRTSRGLRRWAAVAMVVAMAASGLTALSGVASGPNPTMPGGGAGEQAAAGSSDVEATSSDGCTLAQQDWSESPARLAEQLDPTSLDCSERQLQGALQQLLETKAVGPATQSDGHLNYQTTQSGIGQVGEAHGYGQEASLGESGGLIAYDANNESIIALWGFELASGAQPDRTVPSWGVAADSQSNVWTWSPLSNSLDVYYPDCPGNTGSPVDPEFSGHWYFGRPWGNTGNCLLSG